MRRHGYKGAFELAATVDYLFGYDATAARRARTGCTSGSPPSYVFDPETRALFMRAIQPLGAARHHRAPPRGRLRAACGPSPRIAKTLDRLRQVYLDLEGDLEARG